VQVYILQSKIKMAKSEAKRIEGKKPVNRKTQIKFMKRIANNNAILSKLEK